MYASNSGKLNALAPEAYIQPQVNILDNADWESCIINQQTKDEYIGNGHTIDRWSVNNKNIKLRVLKGKISVETLEEITAVSWAPNQDIESAERFQGKILTAATVIDFIDGDWSLFIRFADDNGYIAGPQKKLKTGLNILSYTVPDGTTHIKCGLLSQIQPAGKSVQARKIKLEEGPRFTGWPVWNYALELAKCQRYFYRIPEVIADGFISAAGMFNANGGDGYTVLNFPVPMRVKPALRYGGKIQAYAGGRWFEPEDILLWTESSKDVSYAVIRLVFNNSDMAGKPFLTRVEKGAWLEFNANL